MAILQDVKTLKGITDNLQDGQITILINNAESRLKIWLKQHAGLTTIPEELQFIVTEMVVTRFNRLGSEGMTTESVEGHSVSFTEDDFKPFLSILETYTPDNERTGKALFF